MDTILQRQPAMNTVFEFRFRGVERSIAVEASQEAFEQLALLENKLSRYIPGSDVSRINALQEGASLFLSDETAECLRWSIEMAIRTNGLFDITLGRQIEHHKSRRAGEPPPLGGTLAIDPDRARITCVAPGREIDLGGIGKGFALDRIAALFREGGITGDVLLSAGASTHLGMGEGSWPIAMLGESERRRHLLVNAALSVSGTTIQGAHVVAPDGSPAAVTRGRIWVVAPTATEADALSTAALLATEAELGSLCGDGCEIFAEDPEGRIVTVPAP